MGAGGCWFVSVNNYHYGRVCWQQNEWRPHFNPDTELTTVDIAQIVDLLYERMPEGPLF
jgi:thiamine pyrophosphate-dependent acetolactate synthase large subunit-like protein